MDLLFPIALIVVGLALILMEVYLVPGFNIFGILGVLTILFAVGYAFSEGGAAFGVLALVGSGAAVAGVFWFLHATGAWERFVLSTSLRRDPSAVEREREVRKKFLGQYGVAVTPLRPTGVVEIDGERVEVATEGEFIASGSRVRFVAMDRRRYFVRLADNMPENMLSGS